MNLNPADYTFWGLLNNGIQSDTPIKTLAYLVGLVDTPENEIVNLDKAKFVLSYLFDVEEQVTCASELISVQEESFPKGYFPQTPVMLALRWSPISAMLERGWKPVELAREMRVSASGKLRGMACASGIWKTESIEVAKLNEDRETPENLFWYVLAKIAQKSKARGSLISVIASPGWSYESNVDRPRNFTFAEAEKADRVIWQRTPRRKSS